MARCMIHPNHYNLYVQPTNSHPNLHPSGLIFNPINTLPISQQLRKNNTLLHYPPVRLLFQPMSWTLLRSVHHPHSPEWATEALVTDRAMQLPSNWKTERFSVEDTRRWSAAMHHHRIHARLALVLYLFVYLIRYRFHLLITLQSLRVQPYTHWSITI